MLSGIFGVLLLLLVKQHYALKKELNELDSGFSKRGDVIAKLQEKLETNGKECEYNSQNLQGRISNLQLEKDHLLDSSRARETEFVEQSRKWEEKTNSLDYEVRICKQNMTDYHSKCNEKLREQYTKISQSVHAKETCEASLSVSKQEGEQCLMKYKEALVLIKKLRGSQTNQGDMNQQKADVNPV